MEHELGLQPKPAVSDAVPISAAAPPPAASAVSAAEEILAGGIPPVGKDVPFTPPDGRREDQPSRQEAVAYAPSGSASAAAEDDWFTPFAPGEAKQAIFAIDDVDWSSPPERNSELDSLFSDLLVPYPAAAPDDAADFLRFVSEPADSKPPEKADVPLDPDVPVTPEEVDVPEMEAPTPEDEVQEPPPLVYEVTLEQLITTGA